MGSINPAAVTAFSLRSPVHDPVNTVSRTLVAVELHHRTYGIPIEQVEQIRGGAGIRRPSMDAPAWYLGIIELGGTIVPVVDLRAILDLPRPSPTIVVVRVLGQPMGIGVDAVPAIVESEMRYGHVTDAGEPLGARYIAGFAPQARLPVLDLEAMFACGDMAPVRAALDTESAAEAA